MKAIITSGYFDCLHVGHIECLELAKLLGDKLYVIVNNDIQASLKKGKSFMEDIERIQIIKALRCVDEVFLSIDMDKTVCKSIEEVYKIAKENGATEFIFAKGGDRFNSEIPEKDICDKLGIEMVDGLGDKIQSSSYLLKRIREN